MKLQHELNEVATLILILLSASIVIVGIIMMTRTVYDLNKRLLQLEIANIVRKTESVYNILVETDLATVEKYVVSAQHEVVSSFQDYSFGESGHLFIIDDHRRTILHRDMEAGSVLDFEFAETLITRQRGFLEYVYNDKSRFCVYDTFEPWKWTIALSITKEEMFSYRALFIRIVTIVTGIILFLSIITYLIFSRRITGSIQKTLECLKEVEKGNLNVRIVPNTSTEEIVTLQQGINSMIHKIEVRTAELLKSNEERVRIEKRLLQEELQHKEAEINALQSQINPHFLYNTLECINSIGALHEVEEIQEISISLSNIFKYAIRGGKFVFVEDELRSVKDYLRIQSIRFRDKFSVDLEIESGVLNFRMLKFLLQPIIENSIYHGLEPKMGKGHLSVTGEEQGKTIVFKIRDDGIGMETKNLSYLQNGLNTDTSDGTGISSEKRSIGLFNIQNRIRLVYGDEYGLDIDSHIRKGTTVIMRLPIL
ncbi:histidine kinase [Marispirochaeta aestuarii]|uniref:sensor histidine kinase n=1 Tax=Marispirochaeta aestuarii TaxID=1963862 RepID=UPI0029C6706A|nr:histidine kinase [Marispirochaeta aestuarii]